MGAVSEGVALGLAGRLSDPLPPTIPMTSQASHALLHSGSTSADKYLRRHDAT